MTLIYRLMVLYILMLVIWNMWDEKELSKQIMGGIVIIPLILRFLMIK